MLKRAVSLPEDTPRLFSKAPGCTLNGKSRPGEVELGIKGDLMPEIRELASAKVPGIDTAQGARLHAVTMYRQAPAVSVVVVPALSVVELVMAIEETFGFALSDGDSATLRSVGDLKQRIAARVPSRPSAQCVARQEFRRLQTVASEVLGMPRRRDQGWSRDEISRLVDRLIIEICEIADFSDEVILQD